MRLAEPIAAALVRGRIKLWQVSELTGLAFPVHCQSNQIQATWAAIAARQLGFKAQAGRLDYSLSAMYIEFENVGDPDDPVDIPDYATSEGREYYEDLIGSSTRDFLRVPLRMEPTLRSDDEAIPEDEGNVLTFYAQTTGVEGVHGKTFSSGVNSKICGVALVATPVFADWTRDLVFSRSYLAAEHQMVKTATSQAGITWEINFLTA